MTGRKELRTDFETKIVITSHLFMVQVNFLCLWNLHAIIYVVEVSVFGNSHLGLKKIPVFEHKSDFSCRLEITFSALNPATTQTLLNISVLRH